MINQKGNIVLVLFLFLGIAVAGLVFFLWSSKKAAPINQASNNLTQTSVPSYAPSSLEDYASLADLQTENAIKIQMPSVTPLIKNSKPNCDGMDKSFGIEGIEQASFSCNIYGTNSSVEEVINFYDIELLKYGWIKGGKVTRGSTEIKVVGYCKPKKLFRLAFNGSDRYANLTQGASYKTFFAPKLIGQNSDFSCP
jgi:hypothetical protein